MSPAVAPPWMVPHSGVSDGDTVQPVQPQQPEQPDSPTEQPETSNDDD